MGECRRTSVERLIQGAWYEAFAGLRFGIILARMSLRSAAFGLAQETDDPDDLILFAPLLSRLLDGI